MTILQIMKLLHHSQGYSKCTFIQKYRIPHISHSNLNRHWSKMWAKGGGQGTGGGLAPSQTGARALGEGGGPAGSSAMAVLAPASRCPSGCCRLSALSAPETEDPAAQQQRALQGCGPGSAAVVGPFQRGTACFSSTLSCNSNTHT